jgi:hypothetical protein
MSNHVKLWHPMTSCCSYRISISSNRGSPPGKVLTAVCMAIVSSLSNDAVHMYMLSHVEHDYGTAGVK